MMTLIDLITGALEYSSAWAIYAVKIDGKFRPESPARIGQRAFENGGLLDGAEFFATTERILDFRAEYIRADSREFPVEKFSPYYEGEYFSQALYEEINEEMLPMWAQEAAETLIDLVNDKERIGKTASAEKFMAEVDAVEGDLDEKFEERKGSCFL